MFPSIQDLKQLTPQQRTLLARKLRPERQQNAMFDKPHVRVLAETLQRTLDAATAARRSSLRTP